jgi:hypothetical protein
LDKCVTQEHLEKFIAAGFIAPPHFIAAGILYIEKVPIIASGAFGGKRINVRCSKSNECQNSIDQFEKLIQEILK